MFVLKKTYNDLAFEHALLLDKWNSLVDIINKKGGVDFLNRGKIAGFAPGPQFSQDEIKTLIKLCHPDKHSGDSKAQDITRKLLTMRR